MKLLVITNLFGFPWDPSRGVFNQQQFDRLAKEVDLSVLVAVPWLEALKRPRAYWNARRDGRKHWPYVDYVLFFYLPGLGQGFHSVFFFLSLALQRPFTLFFEQRDALLGSWGFPDAVATAAIAAITGTPMLMKVHGTDINDYLEVAAKRWQILAAARHSRVVMCPSNALRDRLVDAGVPPDRVEVIYNGVDAKRFTPANRGNAQAALGIAAHEDVLLYIGNLKQAKGCVDLLEAFIALAPACPSAVLVFIGGGDALRAMQRRAADAGVAGRVRFMGKLDHAVLPRWLGAARLLCLPSHSEGVPNVVLEAMACGVPVVATHVGGIPEVVPSFAGVLVAPRDVPRLTEALQTALGRHWDVERTVDHARQFSWEANASRVVDLIDQATRRGPQLRRLP